MSMIGGGVFNKQVTGFRISVEFRLKKFFSKFTRYSILLLISYFAAVLKQPKTTDGLIALI